MINSLKWMRWYHILETYYKKYGNIDISYNYVTEDGLRLGAWLCNQRQAYKGNSTNKITKEQINLLNKLGMIWDKYDESWYIYYYALKEYYDKYGNVDISRNYVTDGGLKLGFWLHNQQQAYRGNGTNMINIKKVELLNKLGVLLNRNDRNWYIYFDLLEDYYKKYGNIDISYNYITEDGLKLGSWLCNQRQAYKGNGTSKITEEQIVLLNKLGMIWDKYSENWDKYYYTLEEYYNKYGNINVPLKYESSDGLKLGMWLSTQKRKYKNDILTEVYKSQIQMLNDLDMDWNINDTRILNSVIGSDNKDYYYYILNKRTNYVLRDLSYEVGNQITSSNQEELCKTLVKRIWR